MAGGRQPTNVIIANGRKHLTKAEIEERLAAEVQPVEGEIVAPSYLTAAQKRQFDKLAGQLKKLKIMGETDCDALARYVTAQSLYEQAVKDLRAIQRQRPKEMDPQALTVWANMLNKLDKRQDRYAKQAHTFATALGLTITGRCKLVVPVKDEVPKENKFAKFGAPIKGKAAGGA